MSSEYLMLFPNRAFPELVEEIAATLETNLVPTRALVYANLEIYVRFEESVCGYDVFVIQSHTAPMNEWIMEQLIIVDALRRASARRIIVVAPFYPCARQGKRHLGREPISAQLVASLCKVAGADRIMSTDLHASQIQGSFGGPVDHLWGLPVLSDHIREHYDTFEVCVVSPDAGRARLAGMWTDELGCPLAIVRKCCGHKTVNTVAVREVVGDVRGRTCIPVDNMIDTTGTIAQAALALQERGANKVTCVVTHTVLSGPAVGWLNKPGVVEITVTNTLPIRTAEPIDNLTVLSITPLTVRVINAVFRNGLVTSLFGGQAYK